ncbi:MAG: S8 family serine peptidase [Chloroflexota bacterium]
MNRRVRSVMALLLLALLAELGPGRPALHPGREPGGAAPASSEPAVRTPASGLPAAGDPAPGPLPGSPGELRLAGEGQPQSPADAGLSALQPAKAPADLYAAAAPQSNTPAAAYAYQYEWNETLGLSDNTCGGAHQFVSLAAPDDFAIVDLRVGFNAAHTWRADLQLWLISPGGTRLQLLTGGKGAGADNFDVLFQDGAPAYYIGSHNTAAPYYEYAWAPQGDSLSALAGQPAAGSWQLELCDNAAVDTGTLYRWALFFNAVPAASLSTGLAAPAVVQSGETFTYTLAVANTGSAPAEGLSLTAELPAQVELVELVSPGLAYDPALAQVTWQGRLAQGEQAGLSYMVRAAAGLNCAEWITHTAVLSYTGAQQPLAAQAVSAAWGQVLYSGQLDQRDGGLSVGGTNASWAWGVTGPYTGAQAEYPAAPGFNSRAWATGLTGDYNISENSTLTSPPIDLSQAVRISGYPLYLNWRQWLQTEKTFDQAWLEVRGGAGDWTTAYGPYSGAVDLAWTRHSLDISKFAGVSDFQFRFHLQSDRTAVYAGWYIDQADIVQCSPPDGLYLAPGQAAQNGCNGTPEVYDYTLYNLSGADGVFDLAYTVDPSMGALSGPAALAVGSRRGADFSATLQPLVCLPDGLGIPARIEATGSGFNAAAWITHTITARGAWDELTGLPGSGLYDLAVVDGGDGGLYAIGGGPALRQNLRYDLAGGTWSARPSPPLALQVIDADRLGGVIYLPGGYSGTSIVSSHLAYNTADQKWTSLAPAPRAVAGYGAAACGGKLYRAGGALMSSFPDGQRGAEVYHPGTNSWSALPAMTGGHTWPAVGCLDGRLYVAGGIDESGGESRLVEVYDPAAGSWSTAAALPQARWGAADFILDGRLYLAGGVVEGAPVSSVLAFSPEAGWSQVTTLPQARFRMEGDLGHVIGGMLPAWSAHTDHLLFSQCPACLARGELRGQVSDYDGSRQPVTPAVVTINPGGLAFPVDAGGAYTATLVPWTYQVAAQAPGYPQPVGPLDVSVTGGAVTRQDFSLPRPDLQAAPLVISQMLWLGETRAVTLSLQNRGPLALAYRAIEQPGTAAGAAKPAGAAGLAAAAPSAAPGTAPGSAQAAGAANQGAPQVERALVEQAAAQAQAGYLVYLRDAADLSAAADLPWQVRGRWVVQALQQTAAASQARLRTYLDAQKVDYRAYWIDNLILVHSSTPEMLRSLQSFPEIEALRARRSPTFFAPVYRGEPQPAAPLAVQPNLAHIGAEQVWAQGITGQGIVVANIDTGVNYLHELLSSAYRGSLGGGLFDHNHNWFDPPGGTTLPAPADWQGHGSHTMGTLVGSTNPADPASAANTTGVAPGARWIACRAFEISDQELLDCGQFLAAPSELDGVTNPDPDLRPHIINNSWGDCSTLYDPWYAGVIDAWHALGIYPLFANGNSTNCSYASPPGLGTVGSPARAGNVTGVGATGQSNGELADFSNWGPTDQVDTLNPLGYPRLKPQVVAPGVNLSAGAGGSSYVTMSGTSMATPHVAGLAALMWSAAPCLVGDYVTTETLLQQTADPLPYPSGGLPAPGPGNVPNYATGWGEINAPAAVQAAVDACRTDWLDWLSAGPTQGSLGSGQTQDLRLDFSCSAAQAQPPQPLDGRLRLLTNDPAHPQLDLAVELTCADPTPADLGAALWLTPAAPYAGSVYTYTVQVSNAGPGRANRVTVSAALPAGTELLSSSAACQAAGAQLSCSLGDLPGGQALQLTLQLRAGALPGPAVFSALVSALQSDPQPANNTAGLQVRLFQQILFPLIRRGR